MKQNRLSIGHVKTELKFCWRQSELKRVITFCIFPQNQLKYYHSNVGETLFVLIGQFEKNK